MDSKTIIRSFKDAVPLSDDDYFPIYQPHVFNVAQQRDGDTRKVTVDKFADYILDRSQKNRIVGQKVELLFKPTNLWLLKWRLLELNYQIIKISDYQDLCDFMWVGAADNATAPFWYRCNADGTRNVNGEYMRVADWRGIFGRGAGKNAVYKGANNTPYDGKSPGDFIGDAQRVIRGRCGPVLGNVDLIEQDALYDSWHSDTFIVSIDQEGQSHKIFIPGIDTSRISGFPTSYENCSASISYLACVTY